MASRRQLCTANNKKPKAGPILPIKIAFEEISYRNSLFPAETPLITTPLSCTKCDAVIKPRMISDKNVHPILEILLCKKCRHFYDQRQANENTLFCRWCANDRHLHGCSTCCAKFCETCIEKHFRWPRTIFEEIKQEKWKCCCCFSKPIWDKRAICAQAKNFAESYNNELKDRIARCNASRGSLQRTRSDSSISSVKSSHVDLTKITAPVPNQSLNADEKKQFTGTKNEGNCKENASKNIESDGESCVICLENSAVMVVYPCGHKCLCKQCSTFLSLREKLCPLCRKSFQDVIRVYG